MSEQTNENSHENGREHGRGGARGAGGGGTGAGAGAGGGVRGRVFAAAERISAQRRPTVSTVRAEAQVSNADATRFLREWAQEKEAASRAVAAAPPALLEMAARLAGAYWVEASTIAGERHAGVEAVWAKALGEKDAEIAELAADLDNAVTEKETLITECRVRVVGVEEQLVARDEELRTVRAEADRAVGEAEAEVRGAVRETAGFERDLVTVRTQLATLQDAYDSLLERITPPSGG